MGPQICERGELSSGWDIIWCAGSVRLRSSPPDTSMAEDHAAHALTAYRLREDVAVTSRLSSAEIERLRSLPLTYTCVGGTVTGQADEGYEVFTRTAVVPELSFEQAAEILMTWQVQERAGLRVAASAAQAAEGEVVLMKLGLGAAALRIPCRVVHVIDEPDRVGFAYGTLPGHPESGEELFLLERRGDEIEFRVHAFSRPSTALAKLSGPIGRRFQGIMTRRYLRTMSD